MVQAHMRTTCRLFHAAQCVSLFDRIASHKMRPIVTDAAWSVSVCLSVSIVHERDQCENGWTDRDAVGSVDSWSMWTRGVQRPDLQNILRQSYAYLTIMPKLRSTYDGRLIYKAPYGGRKAFLSYDSLAKLSDRLRQCSLITLRYSLKN